MLGVVLTRADRSLQYTVHYLGTPRKDQTESSEPPPRPAQRSRRPVETKQVDTNEEGRGDEPTCVALGVARPSADVCIHHPPSRGQTQIDTLDLPPQDCPRRPVADLVDVTCDHCGHRCSDDETGDCG